ncbi:DEAD/DEAH box helicase [Nocardioides speluncae]|uniref:DEAD/DEAH box helicase n=1 Tax=Nocardioides speluncae TaxID=2670337 RepID=UPI000D69BF2A|nr:DEAD/DEAH box helicase [Nocardioides speluncae]
MPLSFVPVTGPATFRFGEPARESVVEFTDEQRSVSLPIRAALPVLTRAHANDEAHPSVGLLAGASMLAMRLVAAGRFEPDESGGQWRIGELDAADSDRLQMLARARVYDGLDAATAEGIIRKVLDAVADAMPRRPPSTRSTVTNPPAGSFQDRLRRRLAEHAPRAADRDLPQLVTVSFRVEADEEELHGGRVRVVLQVHEQANHTHVCDAAVLWTEGPEAHGFGERARTHASIALRHAADAWPVLDRLLELRVPDQITLDTDELVGLLDHGVAALQERGFDVLWPRSLGRDLTTRAELKPKGAGTREEPLVKGLFGPDAMFTFSWQVALHGDPLTEAEMDQLASATTPIIKLRDNWTVVDGKVAKAAKKRLIRTVRPTQALAATLTGVVAVEDTDEPVIVGATLEKIREQLRTAATREPVPTPSGLKAELREYQRHGLTWLADMTSLGLGACLADDMGLGKTITLIALHLHRLEASTGSTDDGRRPTLVVCPASLLGNWEAEIRRFAPGVPVRRFHGSARSLDGVHGADLLGDGGGFVLTTYGTMRRDHAALAEVPWDLVVADEAQHIKNPQSSTAKALRAIPSTGRVALTGTPVENNLTELWAILDWAIPGLLGSRNAFRKVWAAPIEAGVDSKVTARFADLISPFLLRRRKSDPGIAPELPPKTETDHLVGLTREQVVLYEALVRDSMARIERADEDVRRGLVLKLLTGLKQICNHPAHYLKQANPRLSGRSEKFDLIDELLGTILAEDGAVLLFTQYVAMARLLEAHLARAGVPHQFLHGGTPVREREELVRRFQDGATPVFLLSLKAGGTGLNLTRADHVIHVDRWWNPAVEDQATDRAYRIGQTKPVQVHRVVAEGTIEQRVAELLTRKRALAESVLGSGEAALTELSNDELRDLVTLRRGEERR